MSRRSSAPSPSPEDLRQFREALDGGVLPDLWDALPKPHLEMLAIMRIARYGSSPNDAEAGILRQLYRTLIRRLAVEDRLFIEQTVCEYVREGVSGVSALVPFLFYESHARVISTTSIDVAMLLPRVNGDELTGPKLLLSQYELASGNEELRLGLLSGLLLLGDERLLPLVEGRWRDFRSDELRRRLAGAWSGLASTLLVEFLVDWLEQTSSESDIGGIVGAMVRMPTEAQGHRIFEVRRCFPAAEAKPGDEFKLTEPYCFAEYAAMIEPRLEPVMAREAPPKLVPMILETWKRHGR